MKDNQKTNRIISKMSIKSSLGYLAIGDVAFKMWRELKAKNDKKNSFLEKTEDTDEKK